METRSSQSQPKDDLQIWLDDIPMRSFERSEAPSGSPANNDEPTEERSSENAPELRIPLPESIPSSNDRLQLVPSAGSRHASSDGDLHANSEQRDRVQDVLPPLPPPPPRLSYWERVQSLSRYLPHLRGIRSNRGRHKFVGRIVCLDHHSSGGENAKLHSVIDIGELANLATIMTKVRQLEIVESPEEIVTRVLLVEDLCPAVIESLGSVFKIDPEVFAAHLNRSGYHEADYGDLTPDSWEAYTSFKSSLKTSLGSYASMTWFRPVYQNPMVTWWTANPSDLLNRAETLTDPKSMPPNRVSWIDPEVPIYDSRRRRIDNRLAHSIGVSTNIFRQSWQISARPFEQDKPFIEELDSDSRNFLTSGNLYEKKQNSVPTAWEERATIFFYEESPIPIAIILLDPLPSFVDNQTLIPNGRVKAGRSRRPIPQTQIALPFAPRVAPELPTNKLALSEDDIKTFEQAANIVLPTAETIKRQVQCMTPSLHDGFRSESVIALLRIVQRDHIAFCRAIDSALNQISQDSLDDYLLTKQLAHWRRLITELEMRLPAVGQSVSEYASTVFHQDFDGKPEIDAIVVSVNKEVDRVKRRLNEAYTGLRADMQFTESRRSIVEAKTVTRLTELAFLFIPLSFTSSLFSMSIQELSNPVPVWTFIVTALGLTILAYAVRLITNSDFIADSSRSALERFWARRNVRSGSDAPVLLLLYLTLQEVWKKGGSKIVAMGGIFIFLSAFVVIPVAFLWTSTKLDAGFKTAMTIFLLFSGLALAAFPYFSNWLAERIGQSSAGAFFTSDISESGPEDNDLEEALITPMSQRANLFLRT